MSIIADKNRHRSQSPGFTIVELMIAVILSAVVFAAIFAGYIFMARNLTRLTDFEQQQVQNRQVLFQLEKDAGNATQVSTAGVSTLVLTMSSGTITYTYSSIATSGPPVQAAQTLVRTDSTTNTTVTQLSNLTTLTFRYYNSSGSVASTTLNIKQIELTYSSAVGNSSNGTLSSNTVTSARVTLKNKKTSGP
jgi:prepilin-type N-terminal cleavage/methylation domain-containing protein